MKSELSSQQLQMPISRLITRIAWPELRRPAPSHGKVQSHAWRLRMMYQHADWRDAMIMLQRTTCPARGAVAKTIALELRKRA